MKKAIFIILFFCFLPGCTGVRVTHTRGYMPILPMPDRPVVEKLTEAELKDFNKLEDGTRAKLIKNSDGVMLYGQKLENTIKLYNDFAEQMNKSTKEGLTSR